MLRFQTILVGPNHFPKSDIVIMNSHFAITLQWIHKLTGIIQFLLNRYCLKQCMIWLYNEAL